MTKDQLFATAKALSKEDQLELAMELWDAVELSESDFPLSPEQRADLDQRIVEDDADPQSAEDWDVLRKKILDGEF